MAKELREPQIDSPLASFITPITVQDIPLYRHFFSQDARTYCYGNSWTYVTQACRGLGLGYKYYDGDMLLSIGRHNGHYVIVRPLGKIDNRFLELLSSLYRVSHRPVFIKKLFPDQVATLQCLENFCLASTYLRDHEQAAPGKYVWDRSAFADDDTYPRLPLQRQSRPTRAVPGGAWDRESPRNKSCESRHEKSSPHIANFH
ncbi:MAG: hypothetical protein HY268_01900 [Deltaproteobacteria bacterium]|nr:hypothetical protein [Deltaproteobacteria bacterium]